ncbi:2-amino-4-hydroxy-6-hydroxymethyldihydropteridine diphosphokinase [Aminipila terrae]|uniref:Bifunctional folate synthesis protein n=1 Tax=Aminipila terrae TaxID=2697030 RepID=A0A6P1MHS2_9FIRM|nr:2-amino-4-hydroxy-6-hydroxymethyldihydropteridine diphosphokinase [Aminipila terrae]QHI71146.1 2-amino-4-hydroxy-6-hydroxymethyldihydropteridine diphosphokinase [Aminipila terrae]
MDRINIKKLEVFAKHGVLPEENVLGQKFLISAVLYTDTRPAGINDDLEKSINYALVCQFITKFMQENIFKLIEAAAEKLAEALLSEFNGLQKIEVEIEKPWAPVGLPLQTVSVQIERSWHTAYIAFGSNMGDKEKYIRQGIEALENTSGCHITKVSEFIQTEPYGGVEQDTFLNGCLELKTLYMPKELLNILNEIEKNAKRERIVRWGPRTLDLDIIFYDHLILSDPELVIPHMDMQNRGFVLEPLNQINPYFRHPVYHLTVEEMLNKLKQKTTE